MDAFLFMLHKQLLKYILFEAHLQNTFYRSIIYFPRLKILQFCDNIVILLRNWEMTQKWKNVNAQVSLHMFLYGIIFYLLLCLVKFHGRSEQKRNIYERNIFYFNWNHIIRLLFIYLVYIYKSCLPQQILVFRRYKWVGVVEWYKNHSFRTLFLLEDFVFVVVEPVYNLRLPIIRSIYSFSIIRRGLLYTLGA